MQMRIYPILALVALAAAGCRMPPTDATGLRTAVEISAAAEPPHAFGIVASILEAPVAPNTVTRLLVEHPDVAAHADRSIVHVDPATLLLIRLPDGTLQHAGMGDLRVGTRHHLWTTGVELRSYTRQVFATRIEILP